MFWEPEYLYCKILNQVMKIDYSGGAKLYHPPTLTLFGEQSTPSDLTSCLSNSNSNSNSLAFDVVARFLNPA